MVELAVIGTGLMGSAASRRLRDSGFRVTLWNRSIEKAEVLARELNVDVARTVLEAIEKAEAALLFLADDDALLDVITSMPRADGLVVANFSTITPKTSLQASKLLEGRGICYLETPIIGGPGVVREGKAIILVSGPKHCLRRSRGFLEALATTIVELSEDIGKASALKLAYNSLLINTIAALAEALLLARSYDVDETTIFNVLTKTMFREVVERYFNRLLAEETPTGFKLSLALKDLEYALRAGYEKGVPLPLTATTSQLYELARRAGLGDKDYTRVYKFLKSIG